MLNRRDVFTSCLVTPLAASLHARTAAYEWLLGSWQSDIKRTVDEYRFSDGRPQPDQQAKLRMAEAFGQIEYLVTDSHFTVRRTLSGREPSEDRWRYSVTSSSANSITVQLTTFLLPAAPPLVLFKESKDTLFIHSLHNREFFNRIT